LNDTLECPLYLAYMLMGGISQDKIGLKLSEKDGAEFQNALLKRRREREKWEKDRPKALS